MAGHPSPANRAGNRPGDFERLWDGGSPTDPARQKPDASSLAEAIRWRGFAIHARALAPDLIAALTSAIDHIVAAQAIPFGANEFPGFRMRRVFNLLAQGEIFECVPVHEALLPAAEQLLGRECLLSSLTAIEMNPGETPAREGGLFPPAAIALTKRSFASLRAAKRRLRW